MATSTKSIAKKPAMAGAKKAIASVKQTVQKKVVRPSARKTVSTCICDEQCKPSHAFWVNNGPVVRSLGELLIALKEMNDEQFAHHTKRGGENDFALWIKECLSNEVVAKSMRKVKTRVGAVRTLAKACLCKK